MKIDLDRTLYEILGLDEPTATPDEVRSRKKALWHRYHEGGTEPNPKLLAEVNNAADVLGDPQKKINYDHDLENERAKEEAKHKEQRAKEARARRAQNVTKEKAAKLEEALRGNSGSRKKIEPEPVTVPGPQPPGSTPPPPPPEPQPGPSPPLAPPPPPPVPSAPGEVVGPLSSSTITSAQTSSSEVRRTRASPVLVVAILLAVVVLITLLALPSGGSDVVSHAVAEAARQPGVQWATDGAGFASSLHLNAKARGCVYLTPSTLHYVEEQEFGTSGQEVTLDTRTGKPLEAKEGEANEGNLNCHAAAEKRYGAERMVGSSRGHTIGTTIHRDVVWLEEERTKPDGENYNVGYLVGLDAHTGAERWRSRTIPGEFESVFAGGRYWLVKLLIPGPMTSEGPKAKAVSFILDTETGQMTQLQLSIDRVLGPGGPGLSEVVVEVTVDGAGSETVQDSLVSLPSAATREVGGLLADGWTSGGGFVEAADPQRVIVLRTLPGTDATNPKPDGYVLESRTWASLSNGTG